MTILTVGLLLSTLRRAEGTGVPKRKILTPKAAAPLNKPKRKILTSLPEKTLDSDELESKASIPEDATTSHPVHSATSIVPIHSAEYRAAHSTSKSPSTDAHHDVHPKIPSTDIPANEHAHALAPTTQSTALALSTQPTVHAKPAPHHSLYEGLLKFSVAMLKAAFETQPTESHCISTQSLYDSLLIEYVLAKKLSQTSTSMKSGLRLYWAKTKDVVIAAIKAEMWKVQQRDFGADIHLRLFSKLFISSTGTLE